MKIIETNGQEFALASRFARWFAQQLDFVILVIPFFIIIGVLSHFGILVESTAFVGVICAFVGVIWTGFYLLFQDGINKGQSFGKRIMSMRVVNAETGAPCSYRKSIVRNLFIIPVAITIFGLLFLLETLSSGLWSYLWGIVFLIPLVNLIDALMIFGDRRQRLGDKLAKTIVVKGNPPRGEVPAEPATPVKTFIIGMGILVGLGVVGYALYSKVPSNFESSDGLVQITAPMLWDDMTRYKATMQMEDSTLVICDGSGDVWVMVITDIKAELGMMSLSQFAEICTEQLIFNLSEVVSVGDPIQATLNGYAAVQYEIQGIVDGDRVTYLHTSIEGKRHYHQVIGFTLSAQKLSDKVQLQQIIESFKELR